MAPKQKPGNEFAPIDNKKPQAVEFDDFFSDIIVSP